jgi:hypothetical protein
MTTFTSITKDYYECERCGITTATDNRLCPCNRKTCDAIKKGSIVITKTIYLDNKDQSSNNRNDFNDLGQIVASINV